MSARVMTLQEAHGRKDTRDGSSHPGEFTAPRLPAADTDRAERRARVASFFGGTAWATAAHMAGAVER